MWRMDQKWSKWKPVLFLEEEGPQSYQKGIQNIDKTVYIYTTWFVRDGEKKF